MHETLRPCLFSIVCIKFDASNKESFVPVSNQVKPLPKTSTSKLFFFK